VLSIEDIGQWTWTGQYSTLQNVLTVFLHVRTNTSAGGNRVVGSRRRDEGEGGIVVKLSSTGLLALVTRVTMESIILRH
jgi:hypothetical protein